MSWLSDRLSEKTSQAAIAQLITIWGGVAAAYVGGASAVPMNLLLSSAITATVPCLVAFFQSEHGKQNPPPAGP